MSEWKRSAALAAGAYSLRGIPKNYILILDGALVNSIPCDLLYFPKGRSLMTDHKKRGLAHDALVQLGIYATQAFASLAVFGLFFFASLAAGWLCSIWPESGIMVKIV